MVLQLAEWLLTQGADPTVLCTTSELSISNCLVAEKTTSAHLIVTLKVQHACDVNMMVIHQWPWFRSDVVVAGCVMHALAHCDVTIVQALTAEPDALELAPGNHTTVEHVVNQLQAWIPQCKAKDSKGCTIKDIGQMTAGLLDLSPEPCIWHFTCERPRGQGWL